MHRVFSLSIPLLEQLQTSLLSYLFTPSVTLFYPISHIPSRLPRLVFLSFYEGYVSLTHSHTLSPSRMLAFSFSFSHFFWLSRSLALFSFFTLLSLSFSLSLSDILIFLSSSLLFSPSLSLFLGARALCFPTNSSLTAWSKITTRHVQWTADDGDTPLRSQR